MPKPKYGKTVTEARRLRENLQRRIKRAEERGYRFWQKLPEIPKTTKYKDYKPYYEKLKEWQKNFYEKYATGIDYESAEIISGTEKRKQERSRAAQQAARTREKKKRGLESYRKNRELNPPQPVPYDEYDEEFEEQWRQQRAYEDELERARAAREEYLREQIYRGNIIIDRVYDMINDATSGRESSREALRALLDKEIATYGKDVVARSIEPYEDEFMEYCQAALSYGKGSNQQVSAINHIEQLIKGYIPTAEESRELQDAIESDDDAESEYQ